MVSFFQTQFGFSLLLMGMLIGFIMFCVAYGILLERKIAAYMQDRIGPNRAGPRGILQPIADGIKFFMKEDIIPANVDRPLFILAPAISFTAALVLFAVIPWAGQVDIGGPELVNVQVASVDIGLLYILGVGSLGVYGVVLGGWASNNKYSFFGGMRSAAQMLSYEIPLGIAVLIVVLTTGDLRLENIVFSQMNPEGGVWNVLLHPAVFMVMLVAVFAEANRAPFDLPEAEQELVSGYMTEYSSMKMALYYLGEYVHIIVGGAFLAVLFFGGWELFPFSDRLGWGWIQWLNHDTSITAAWCRFGVMFGKIFLIAFFFMWVRWTLPRFRFDQLMRLAWQGLLPLALALLGWAILLVYFGRPVSIWAPLGNIVILVVVRYWQRVFKTEITGRQAGLSSVVEARKRTNDYPEERRV
jgi:NADH-quinone oxidoreductase subunit H